MYIYMYTYVYTHITYIYMVQYVCIYVYMQHAVEFELIVPRGRWWKLPHDITVDITWLQPSMASIR